MWLAGMNLFLLTNYLNFKRFFTLKALCSPQAFQSCLHSYLSHPSYQIMTFLTDLLRSNSLCFLAKSDVESLQVFGKVRRLIIKFSLISGVFEKFIPYFV